MPSTGAAVYSPSGLPNIVDSNSLQYASTTTTAATIIGAGSVPVVSAASFSIGQFVQVDTSGLLAEVVEITAIVSNTLSVFPLTKAAHATGATISAVAVRQILTLGDATTPANQSKILANGALTTALNGLSTVTRTSVSSTLSVVQLLAANSSRQAAFFYNSSSAALYLICGTGGSSSDYSTLIGPSSSSPLPAAYVGVIQGVWSAVNGSVFITEFSP